MSSQDSDISWQVLGRIIQDWAGTSAELAQVQPLDGGVINTTLCLTLADGQRAVLKISPHRVNRDYQREALQLELIRSLGLPTPSVFKVQTGSLDDPHSFILMEFIDGMDFSQARRTCTESEFEQLQCHLAEIILQLHQQKGTHYGRVGDDESAAKFERWPDFFREIYTPMLKEAMKIKGLSPKARKQLDKIHSQLERLIAHEDSPRLVHWDVWSTNLMARPDDSGRWRVAALLDPNCKYAHAEAEIAYIDLFHTCTPAFLKAYQAQLKLDDGYHRVRKTIYQLYSLIDHVNLFGHGYVKPLLANLERAAAL